MKFKLTEHAKLRVKDRLKADLGEVIFTVRNEPGVRLWPR